MKTTVEFLDAVMKKHDIKSDNQLALNLGCTRQSISGYRREKTYLDDHIAMRVADLLDIDAAYVVACVHAERAKKPAERQLWERMAISLGGIAATLVLAMPMVTMTGIESASLSYGDGSAFNNNGDFVYIMRISR